MVSSLIKSLPLIVVIMTADPEKRGGIQCLSEDEDTSSITLTNVTESDKHVYYCRLTDYWNIKWTVIPGARLDVTDPPKSVSVSISPSGEIVSGDSVTLNCSSDSNPPALNFSWFKENETSSVGSGQSFSISSFNSSFSGRFYCEAQNKYGSQRSASVSLAVKANQRDDLYANIKAKKPKRSGRKQAESDSEDVEEVLYASVHHFKNKDMKKTEENDCQTIETHHPSEANRSEDVIYSSCK
ncbi:B-cell receptor CD22 [Anabarilius grahami]|uniref:B-cell receptor CD22 n=1 Tax=Anabarilius grahami TaxID=495550 RepID=A0A3N0Z0D1_ANAGA|nr:B-cell receptor CD22 [Anabarilius grahami]